MEPATFMYFWLNYCDENHIERIPIPVKNIGHLFHLASEIVKAERLHLFLLSDGTRNDETFFRLDQLVRPEGPEDIVEMHSSA